MARAAGAAAERLSSAAMSASWPTSRTAGRRRSTALATSATVAAASTSRRAPARRSGLPRPPEYGFGTTRYGSCGFYQQARGHPRSCPPRPASACATAPAAQASPAFGAGPVPAQPWLPRLHARRDAGRAATACTSRRALGGCVQGSWHKARCGAGVREAGSVRRGCVPVASSCRAGAGCKPEQLLRLRRRRRGRGVSACNRRASGHGAAAAALQAVPASTPTHLAPRLAWPCAARADSRCRGEGAHARATLRPGAWTTATAVRTAGYVGVCIQQPAIAARRMGPTWGPRADRDNASEQSSG